MQQFSFVHGRKIFDPTLIANEVVDFWQCSKKKKGVVIKLDIEKAFDKVNWAFLLSMLQVKGFLEIWIHWIKACIYFVNYSIILNGKPRGYIQATRGVRQEDSLSPFLLSKRLNKKISSLVVALKMNSTIFYLLMAYCFSLVQRLKNSRIFAILYLLLKRLQN